MAITGSGSLAISLFVFVISAAFLPKGESASPLFFPPSACLERVRGCFCGVAPFAAEAGRGDDVGGGEKLRWRLRVGMRASCAANRSITFLPRRCGLLRDVVAVFKAAFFGVLS